MTKQSCIGVWLAILGVVLLQGCREEEQNRPLAYQKGTYQGQADEPLAPDKVDALRQRAAGQKF
jgi:hypothetical protein